MSIPCDSVDHYGRLIWENPVKNRVSPCSKCPKQTEAIQKNGAPCDDYNGAAGYWRWQLASDQSSSWKDVDCATCQYRDQT